jgi:hypothetical protein
MQQPGSSVGQSFRYCTLPGSPAFSGLALVLSLIGTLPSGLEGWATIYSLLSRFLALPNWTSIVLLFVFLTSSRLTNYYLLLDRLSCQV